MRTADPTPGRTTAERVDTIVIGGGQAGLSVGQQLRRLGRDFVILEAAERVGDSWRRRWDSLRLFTPARYDGLAGKRFPGPAFAYPTKDEFADYLEAYAEEFELPVRTGMRVERLTRDGEHYVVEAGGRRFEARNVVVAMCSWQQPVVPDFAGELDPRVVQLHAGEYRNPGQLRDGDLLVVGAGNSGAEIALDARAGRRVWLAGRDVGHVPFRIESRKARVLVPIVLRGVFHRLLTTRTPMGRRRRPGLVAHGHMLVRTKPSDLAAAGIERAGRVIGVRHGLPELADGRVLEVANVIWATGFRPDFSWIELPGFDSDDPDPTTQRGIVPGQPGLYFIGLLFLYAGSSMMIHGLERDTAHVAAHLEAHRPAGDREAAAMG